MSKKYSNLSDDELDKLFTEAAENSSFDFEEQAWQQMQKQLDGQSTKPASASHLKKISLALLLLLVGSALYFAYNFQNNNSVKATDVNNKEAVGQNKNESNTQTLANKEVKTEDPSTVTQNNTVQNPGTSAAPEGEKTSEKIAYNESELGSKDARPNEKAESIAALPSPKAAGKTRDAEEVIKRGAATRAVSQQELSAIDKKKNIATSGSKTNTDIITNNNETTEEVHQITENNKNESKAASESTKRSKISSKERVFQTGTNSNNFSKAKNTQAKQVAENNYSSIAKTANTESAGNMPTNQTTAEVAAEKFTTSAQIQAISAKALKALAVKMPMVQVKSLSLDAPKMPEKSVFDKGFAVRLAASPDMSTIKGNGIEKIGSNVGILFEYRFGPRISLQAGLIRSMKKYEAYPEQYEWKWGWPQTTKLMDIQAQCKMLDIPISLRYDFSQGENKRVFGSFGVTSYKMLNEIYDYNFENNSDPSIKFHRWAKKTGTYFSASNLDFSFGMEQKLARKISLQVEPFARIPLRSIGFGNVPLISYGLMFSGKYALKK